MKKVLFGTAKRNQAGNLEIGGCDTVQLAKEYGTPLYIYDTALIKQKARAFKQTFEDLGVSHRVTYASKAFTSLAMYQLIQAEGLACDVVSAGEMYTALKAGIEPEQIAFHGNNKTPQELEMAVEEQIGLVILDNFYEIELLEAILAQKERTQKVLLRVAPGIDAYTHEFVMTGQEDSKFGFDVKSGQAETALQQVLNSPYLDFQGVHCHIGSQIFDTEAFHAAINRMLTILVAWREKLGLEVKILNLGGGFGAKYVPEDDPLEAAEYVRQIVEIAKKTCAEQAYPLPEIWIEPGRSIVAEAGTTLYTVGAQKNIPGIRKYVSVDGGMGENIRTPLYDAHYHAVVANKTDQNEQETVTITGKYCESGDVLIHEITLPRLDAGDLLAMQTTGAYGYSMASNYNRNPRPAVVFVEDGQSQLVVRRETFADLVHLDLPLNS